MLSKQELFDRVAQGIIAQDYRQAISPLTARCVVQTKTGDRCALGHCVSSLPEGEVRIFTECTHLARTVLGGQLQRAHDVNLGAGQAAWEEAMSEIALIHGLSTGLLYVSPEQARRSKS